MIEDGGDDGGEVRVLLGALLEEIDVFFEEAGMDVAGDEVRLLDQGDQERDVVVDAQDLIVAQGPLHPPPRLVAVGTPGDQLRDHGVVEDGDLEAFRDTGVDAYAGAAGS